MPESSDILLVDDNPADARLFETALRDASSRARTFWVASGEEAIEFLAERGRYQKVGTVKIVVLDLNLPGQGGLDTLKRIKGDPNSRRTPVIVLSSTMAQDEIDLSYSLGANAFFRKPVTLERYVELVRVIAQHWLDLARLPAAGRPFDIASALEADERFHREL